MRNGTCFRRSEAEPRIAASACSFLLPTPHVRDHHAQGAGMNPKAHSVGLSTLVEKMWPTPRACDGSNPPMGTGKMGLEKAAKMWPTPAARDWKSGQVSEATRDRNSRPLNEAVMWPTPKSQDAKHAAPTQGELASSNFKNHLHIAVKGRLNPDWVEWLMGWPIGWSDAAPRGDTSPKECRE